MNLPLLVAALAFLFLFAGAAYLIAQAMRAERKAKTLLQAQAAALKRQAYEAEILRELGERFGYELNEAKIVDIILGSIGKLFTYSTLSSMLFKEGGEEIDFKISLEESVNTKYIQSVKETMLAALEALEGQPVRKLNVSQQVTGTVTDETNPRGVGSFFNIPIVINDKLTGLLSITSTSPRLYREEEMIILYRIVSQASTAVTKLRHVLETEKGKLSSMVFSMTDGVVMVDNDMRLQVINSAARYLLGIKEAEPSIFTVIKALSPKLDLKAAIDEAGKSDSLKVIDELILDERVIKIFVSPVKDRNGKSIGVVVTLHDISKEKELERLREDFIAMMVHELRSPLTAVRGASSALLEHTDQFSPEKKVEYLHMIEGSALEMLGTVNDLLDVAKIEAGKFAVNPQETDVRQLVETKVNEFLPVAQEKLLQLRATLPTASTLATIDPERIGQVLANLLSNAIKFTDKGGIDVILEDKGNEVLISVKDTGAGIDPKDQPRLFSKFAQFETKKPRTAKGTGLGLVIAKGIVESHGGKIFVESKKGEGSSFRFILPKQALKTSEAVKVEKPATA